jgi:serine/threonine protein kinase
MGVGLENRDENPQPPEGDTFSAATDPKLGSFVPPDPADLAPFFPHLEIEELLGHGGTGAVYKARQTKLDRIVALKIIKPESAGDPAFAERFSREARTLVRLNHPHIVAVHDFGEAGDLYYFIMEYVDGTDLRQLLKTQRLEPEQAFAVIPQICEALQFAHDNGVVHRDIKPENILLDKQGRVKIADFGLAKLAGGKPEDFTLTGTHQVMGTPRYMAPEQMEGSHQVDHRADIYSLGVVFYEMLTGELPLGRFDPPSHKARVDARLDVVVLKTLAREPDRRYQQASQVKSDIERLSCEPVAASHARGQFATGKPPLVNVDFVGARRQVQGPAIGLILVGVVNILLPLLVTCWFVIAVQGTLNPSLLSMILLAVLGLGVPAGLLMVIAGLKMRTLEMNGLAMTASILTILPITVGSIIGLPIGIWSLTVLNRAEVKSAFAGERNTWNELPLPPLPLKPAKAAGDALSENDHLRIKSMVRGPATGLILVGLLNLLLLVMALVVLPTSTGKSSHASAVPAPVSPVMVTLPIAQTNMLQFAQDAPEIYPSATASETQASAPWWSSRFGFFLDLVLAVGRGSAVERLADTRRLEDGAARTVLAGGNRLRRGHSALSHWIHLRVAHRFLVADGTEPSRR